MVRVLLLGGVPLGVVRLELGSVRDVIVEHDLLWVRGARQELLAGADLLEDLLGLEAKRDMSITLLQSGLLIVHGKLRSRLGRDL